MIVHSPFQNQVQTKIFFAKMFFSIVDWLSTIFNIRQSTPGSFPWHSEELAEQTTPAFLAFVDRFSPGGRIIRAQQEGDMTQGFP